MYRPKIVFFYRKRRPGLNFSIERIFEDVIFRLPERYDSDIKIAKYFSNGILPRLLSCLDARAFQGEINHITGDIHFINLFFNRKKTILTIHDIGFLETSNGIKQFILKLFWLILPAYKSKFITVVSNSTKQEILKYHSKIKSKIIVIPSSISEKFTYSPKPVISEKPRLLQIGTGPNKNIDRLIYAISDIDCHLDIVGKLSNDTIQSLTKKNIQYTNYYNLGDEEIINLYKECDILTFVSTYEGFGMPIIEANKIGRAVITSNIYSMPEVAGDSACIVDPFSIEAIKNGINKIINNNLYRKQLIEKGLKNADRYSAQLIAEKYFELYELILNDGGNTAKRK